MKTIALIALSLLVSSVALPERSDALVLDQVYFTGTVHNISRRYVVLKTRNGLLKIPRKYFNAKNKRLTPGKVVKVRGSLEEVVALNQKSQVKKKKRRPASKKRAKRAKRIKRSKR